MLIAYICIAEACMSFNALVQVIGPVYFICYAGLEEMWVWTTKVGEITQEQLTCGANLLCHSNGTMFQGFQLLSLSLNICLCCDLILTIQSPFTPATSRNKFYYLGSAVAPSILVMIIYLTSGENGDCYT